MSRDEVLKRIQDILNNLDGVCTNKFKSEAVLMEVEKMLAEITGEMPNWKD